MNDQLKDIAVRAGKTFLQGAIAYGLLNYAAVQDVNGAKAFALGAVAAGVSAVWNLVVFARQK